MDNVDMLLERLEAIERLLIEASEAHRTTGDIMSGVEERGLTDLHKYIGTQRERVKRLREYTERVG